MADGNNTAVSPSWSWVAGTLLTLLLIFAGYGWTTIDARITRAEEKTSALTVDQARTEAHYEEIIRRLERIEEKVEQSKPTVRTEPRPR